MTDVTMTQDEFDELAHLCSIDSANMPTSMAVNQEQLAQAASAPMPAQPRSKYYGVYNNTGGNKDTLPYRSAVRLGTKQNPRFVNLGYFKCEHVAAIAYNVAAINYFGKKSWINPVDTAKCNPAEYDRYKELRAEYIAKSVTALKAMHSEGQHPNQVDLERTAATA